MADKDRKFKDYDSSLLRFVGNCVASKDWSVNDMLDTKKTHEFVDATLELAFYTRKRIRKIEEDNG